MPMERRGRVIRVIPTLVNRQREEPTGCDGERQLSMDGTSRVSREAQARICERLGVRLPGATRPRGATPRGYSPNQVQQRHVATYIDGMFNRTVCDTPAIRKHAVCWL